jgi:hypothetical protein
LEMIQHIKKEKDRGLIAIDQGKIELGIYFSIGYSMIKIHGVMDRVHRTIARVHEWTPPVEYTIRGPDLILQRGKFILI